MKNSTPQSQLKPSYVVRWIALGAIALIAVLALNARIARPADGATSRPAAGYHLMSVIGGWR